MKSLLLLTLGILSSSLARNIQVLRAFMTGYNQVCTDFYTELSKTNPENFIMCPLSADLILAFARSGARGQTAAEITAGLRLPESLEDTHAIFKFIASTLQSTENYTLNSANKMYVKDGFQISDNFNKISVNVFDARTQNIDFSKNEETAREINRWVEVKTHNKIKDLIKPNVLSALTRLVLVNTVYFHAKWKNKFHTQDTTTFPFVLPGGKGVLTDMMQLKDRFGYYESLELNALFLKLDYEGGDVSMHIVLPKTTDGLPALEARIADALTPPKYSYENVSVTIPKFKIETEINLIPILRAMGIKTAFKNNADFGGIGANQDKLVITEVLQKAFIEVEETGTTAGAATYAGFIDRIVGSGKTFYAGHPFLFYLRLNKLGMNLFVGRFTSPEDFEHI